MTCYFPIDFPQIAGQLVKTAENLNLNTGGKFPGDASNEGNFSIRIPYNGVKGNYYVKSSALLVIVDEKPMLLRYNRIERIKKLFNQPVLN